jgi:hypothetical protein
MKPRLSLVIAMLTLVIAIPLSAARADPIVIHGSVIVSSTSSGATGHLQASDTLVFSDRVGFGGSPMLCLPCGPAGASLNLSTVIDTVDGGGSVQIAGHTYPFGSIGVDDTAVMALTFAADPVILPALNGTGVISTPFRLGTYSKLFVYDAEGFATTFSLTGRGTARIELIPNPFIDVWELGQVRYEFAPVPEPATVLLFGSGVLGLCGARRRQRRAERTPER